MTVLTYEKWGTRIAECDENDDRLRRSCFEIAKKTAEMSGWELLPGPVERVPVGYFDGDRVYAYLWPVVRPAAEAVSD